MMTAPASADVCVACGTRFDAQHFDALGFVNAPAPGRRIVIARFELPSQFCGVLHGFQQLASVDDDELIETPGIEWQLRVNGRPLDPYLGFQAVLNRWGHEPPRLAIAVDEGHTIELAAQGIATDPRGNVRLGGRLMGRYWFNDAHGLARAR